MKIDGNPMTHSTFHLFDITPVHRRHYDTVAFETPLPLLIRTDQDYLNDDDSIRISSDNETAKFDSVKNFDKKS